MAGNNILITGGNRGIGLAMIQQYIADGHTVTVLCRNVSKTLSETGATILPDVDVTDHSSLVKAKQTLNASSFDILINNAGILHAETLDNIDLDAIRQINAQFEVNALAPLMVSSLFIDCISDGGKIAMITSRMGSIADNSSGARYGYRMSKAALNAAAKSMAIDLTDRHIAVGIFHPGWVQTDMTGGTGQLHADDSAALLRKRIHALSMKTSGRFFHANGDELPW